MDKHELKKIYKNKSDEELLFVLSNEKDYTVKTLDAVKEIVKHRGGIDALVETVTLANDKQAEIQTLRNLVINGLNKGKELSEIRSTIQSKYLNSSQVEELVNSAEKSYLIFAENRKTTTKSLLGGIIGGVIGGLIGGLIWGLQMIWSGHVFILLFFGLLVCSYFFVRLFSRKDRNNVATAIITVVSAIVALVVGENLFHFYGTMEYLN